MLCHARSPVRRAAEWPTDLAYRQYRPMVGEVLWIFWMELECCKWRIFV